MSMANAPKRTNILKNVMNLMSTGGCHIDVLRMESDLASKRIRHIKANRKKRGRR